MSRRDLDQAATQLAVKKAQVGTINAQIARNEPAGYRQDQLAYTRIEAPMDGDVVQITTLQARR